MTIGLVGRKVGMTRIFTDDGSTLPVTVLDVSDNRVTQVKTADTLPDATAPLEARPVGHLGIFLITQLAERCDYARTGDRNCITVELPAPR